MSYFDGDWRKALEWFLEHTIAGITESTERWLEAKAAAREILEQSKARRPTAGVGAAVEQSLKMHHEELTEERAREIATRIAQGQVSRHEDRLHYGSSPPLTEERVGQMIQAAMTRHQDLAHYGSSVALTEERVREIACQEFHEVLQSGTVPDWVRDIALQIGQGQVSRHVGAWHSKQDCVLVPRGAWEELGRQLSAWQGFAIPYDPKKGIDKTFGAWERLASAAHACGLPGFKK